MNLLAMVGSPTGGMPKLKKTEPKEVSPRKVDENAGQVDFRANLKKSPPQGAVKLVMPVPPKKSYVQLKFIINTKILSSGSLANSLFIGSV